MRGDAAGGARSDRGPLPQALVVLAVLAVAISFLGAAPWLRAYQVPGGAGLLALAAVLPVLVSAAVSRALRSPPVLSFTSSLTGLAALLGLSNGFDFNSIWDGLVHVPPQLLTETLPLGGSDYLLAAPLVLTWLCAGISAELLFRPEPPSPAVPLVGSAYFCLAFAATTSAPPGRTTLEGAAVLGAAVAMALARQASVDARAPEAGPLGPEELSAQPRRRRQAQLRRATLGALAAAAVATGLGTAVPAVPALASKPAAVARQTQLVSGTVVDPVDALASLRTAAPPTRARPLFSVDVTRPWSGYVTVATLSTYDGDIWSFVSTFRPTGGRVPDAASLPGRGDPALTQHYLVQKAIGLPFLPAVDRPVQVDGIGVDADASTGMLAAAIAPPAAYTVVSRAPAATGEDLPSDSALASPGTAAAGTLLTQLPPGPQSYVGAAVRFAVNLTGQPASPSFGFLQDLALSLQAKERWAVPRQGPGRAAESAPGGTSLAQVMNAVTVDRAATPEQFATFFAVVGRYLGVPVRVVTGFRVPAAAARPQPLPQGRYQLSAADAWTWDEVPVVGYGWVAVDPTPVLTTSDPTAPPEQVKAVQPPRPKPATALPGAAAPHAAAKPVRVGTGVRTSFDWRLWAATSAPAGLLVGAVTWWLLVPATRRRLRRVARGHNAEPELLAAGAWLELLDGLARLGVDIVPSATTGEVVEQVAESFGPQYSRAAAEVAAVADQALYSRQWPLDAAVARHAWSRQADLCRSLRRQAGGRQRARSLVAVGPAPARPSAPRP
jgi:hypothetical protein